MSDTRYPIVAVHIRVPESTTVYSVASEDPQILIRWLGDMIDRLSRHEVLFDHDYSVDRQSTGLVASGRPETPPTDLEL